MIPVSPATVKVVRWFAEVFRRSAISLVLQTKQPDLVFRLDSCDQKAFYYVRKYTPFVVTRTRPTVSQPDDLDR